MTRTAWQVLIASAASFALAALLPAAPLGGVRGMVVVLPVATALFASVARAAGAPRLSALEAGLWSAWGLFALSHFALGLPGSAVLAVAGGLILAGARTLRLALLLRRRIASAALWPFFALPLALYLVAWPWATTARAPDGDEPYYLLLAHSLAEDADVDLTDEYRDEAWRSFTPVRIEPQPGDPVGARGELYSRHSALLPLLLAPLYLLAGPFGAQLGMLAFAAATALAGLAAARVRYRRYPSGLLAAWMTLAFAPPLLLYAGQIWVEVPAALCLALALAALARLDEPGTSASSQRASLLALALPLVALPLLKLRFLALALPLGLLAFGRMRGAAANRRRILFAGAATIAGLGAWNLWRYGNPLRMYRGSDLAIFSVPLAGQVRGDLGLFFDLAFGLFALAPIWLLVLPAFATALRDRWRGLRPPALLELASLMPYLLLIGMRREWYGGWSPPFRYGVVLLPALALLLPPLFRQRRTATPLFGLVVFLASTTAAVALVYLVHPAWAYSLANGSSRLVDELSSEFGLDLARFLPSMVRPRAATWIVPLVVTATTLAVAALGSQVWRRRPSAARAAIGSAGALLLGWSLWVYAASSLPTHRVEFEDAWLRQRSGALFPERWTVDRTRFDGGWALRRQSEVEFRPVRGGSNCRVAIRLSTVSVAQAPLVLEVLAGDRPVARWTLSPAAKSSAEAMLWTVVETQPFALADGEALRFRAVDATSTAARGFVILDWAELAWR